MSLIKSLLVRDEGYRRSAYQDSEGFWTIGIGRLIDVRRGGGISIDEAEFLLENDIRRCEVNLGVQYSWFLGLDEVRRAVLTSMAFQMGTSGLAAFHRTLKAVEEGRYSDAADAMLASKWASQTPLRAGRLAEAMRTGDVAAFRLSEDP